LDTRSADRLVRRYWSTINELDVDAMMDLWCPDGVLADPVGANYLVGRDRIREHKENVFKNLRSADGKVTWVMRCGDEIATTVALEVTGLTGRLVTLDFVGILRTNDSGQLSSALDYYDVAALRSIMP